MYGIERLLADLRDLGYDQMQRATGSDGQVFAVLPDFVVPLGRFRDRVITLAVPAPPDYPRTMGASIHVSATPPLLEIGSVPNVRNILQSSLGAAWQYWSHKFTCTGQATRELMAQINRVFNDV